MKVYILYETVLHEETCVIEIYASSEKANKACTNRILNNNDKNTDFFVEEHEVIE